MRTFSKIDIGGTLESRFWRKVLKSDSGCWCWTGSKTKKGYGKIRLASDQKSPMVLASRVSWVIHNKQDAGQLLVCHTCDNPSCVNPKHLFLGAYTDNNLDMKNKNRHSKGEFHASAKISEADAKNILLRYASGEISMSRLGRKYGIGTMQVCRIVHGSRWAHLSRDLPC